MGGATSGLGQERPRRSGRPGGLCLLRSDLRPSCRVAAIRRFVPGAAV